MSETVTFTCGFATTFEQIEDLRCKCQAILLMEGATRGRNHADY